jgi:hypothetical protein
MKTKYKVLTEAGQTEGLRLRFENKRRFLKNFYKRDCCPGKVAMVTSVTLIFFIALFFFSSAELDRSFYFIGISAIITSLSVIFRFFKNQKS